jgi:uncharacterized protein YqjF (DUF2071 family)
MIASEARFSESRTCAAARQRLLAVKGDPFLIADWDRTLFFHYLLEPELVRKELPAPLELELHHGKACVSLVVVTMRRFRPYRRNSLEWLLPLIREQRFLNFRTYARCGDEPGAVFLWGWLSQPVIGLPSSFGGLPYAFARFEDKGTLEQGEWRGNVCAPLRKSRPIFGALATSSGHIAWRATIPNQLCLEPCPSGSLAEFAMERYSGVFWWGSGWRVFRAWHPPWKQAAVEAEIKEAGLIIDRFPWFRDAVFAGANVAEGISDVWLGRPHRLENIAGRARKPSSTRSAFFEMP